MSYVGVVIRPSLALAVGDVLALWEAFFYFLFPSYGRFRGPAILRPFRGSQKVDPNCERRCPVHSGMPPESVETI